MGLRPGVEGGQEEGPWLTAEEGCVAKPPEHSAKVGLTSGPAARPSRSRRVGEPSPGRAETFHHELEAT